MLDEFQQVIKCPFRIVDNTIEISKKRFNYEIDAGGSLLISGVQYVRLIAEATERHLLSLTLPKIPEIPGNVKISELHEPYSTILYGKKVGTSQFSVQLDDVFAEFEDIPQYLDPGHGDTYLVALAIDKSAKMNDVEKLLYQLRLNSSRRVVFLSSDSVNYSLRTTRGLRHNLPPIFIDDLDSISPPLPPRLRYDLKSMIEDDHFQLIQLIENELLYESVVINRDELEKRLFETLLDTPNKLSVLVYDQHSSYESYILALDKIHSAYAKCRNFMSVQVNGVEFAELDSISKQIFYKKHPTLGVDISTETWEKATRLN